jgi:serine protease Do
MNLLNLTAGKFALLGCATALLLGGTAQTASADVYTKGRLSVYSPISSYVRPGCYFHKHVVTLRAGVTYTIDLRSADFDAYLVLADDDGRILAEDDDSGGGLDARIVFRAPYTGDYEIYTTTYSPGAVGNYTLIVRP